MLLINTMRLKASIKRNQKYNMIHLHPHFHTENNNKVICLMVHKEISQNCSKTIFSTLF